MNRYKYKVEILEGGNFMDAFSRLYLNDYELLKDKNDVEGVLISVFSESDKIITTDYVGYNWIYRDESVSNTTQKKVANSPIPFLDIF